MKPTSKVVTLTPGWQSIKMKFLEMVNREETDGQRAEDQLIKLHKEVIDEIYGEMEITSSIIDGLSRERHCELILHTNERLDRLSQSVKTVLSMDMLINLIPIDISFEMMNKVCLEKKLPMLLEDGLRVENFERNFVSSYLIGKTYSIYNFDAIAIKEHFESLVRYLYFFLTNFLYFNYDKLKGNSGGVIKAF